MQINSLCGRDCGARCYFCREVSKRYEQYVAGYEDGQRDMRERIDLGLRLDEYPVDTII